MARNKTVTTDENVFDFINEFVSSETKKSDSYRLIELMKKASGHEPKMYGPSIIGFGNYHYKYASGHEGDAPLIGFSPRKAAITLYVHTGSEEQKRLLENLGNYKISKACIYIKKLSDIDENVLTRLMKDSIKFLKKKYG